MRRYIHPLIFSFAFDWPIENQVRRVLVVAAAYHAGNKKKFASSIPSD